MAKEAAFDTLNSGGSPESDIENFNSTNESPKLTRTAPADRTYSFYGNFLANESGACLVFITKLYINGVTGLGVKINFLGEGPMLH